MPIAITDCRVLDLPGAERGSRPSALLVRVAVPPAQRLRLAELGLRPGVRVRVLGRTVGGGRVLGLGATRLAVDRGIAAGLIVEPERDDA